jgi:hypothetical protein
MGILALLGWSLLGYGTVANNFTAVILGFSSATAFSGMWFAKKLWKWSKDNVTSGLK